MADTKNITDNFTFLYLKNISAHQSEWQVCWRRASLKKQQEEAHWNINLQCFGLSDLQVSLWDGKKLFGSLVDTGSQMIFTDAYRQLLYPSA